MPVSSQAGDPAATGAPPDDRRATPMPVAVRIGSAVALLAILGLGLRRPDLEFLPSSAPASGSVLTEVLAWVLIPLSCCAGILLLAVIRWRRRRVKDPGDTTGAPGWLTALLGRLAGVLALATVGLAVWWVFRTPPDEISSTTEPPPPSTVDNPPAGVSRPNGEAGASVDLVLIAVVAAVCLLLLIGAIVIARARQRVGDLPAVQDGHPEASALAEAVDAGRQALRGPDDDRAAIIACYVAMEDAFARHGVRRENAETASEHLHRVTEAGLVGGDAVRELVAVFGRARFSDRPIRPGDRASVERILDDVRVRLGEPV